MTIREDKYYYERKFEESVGSLRGCVICLIGMIICLVVSYLINGC